MNGLLQRVVLLVVLLGSAMIMLPMSGSAQQTAESEKVFKIQTIERRPFTIISPTGYSGFGVDLWKELAGQLDMRYEFATASTFIGMLEAVKTGDADAAIGNISITADREASMDFTQPIFDAGLQIMIPENNAAASLAGALFTWDMFGLLAMGAIVLFLAGSMMWVFERRAQPYFEHPYKDVAWRSFWWALIVVVNGGFEERMPMSWPGRFFAVVLVVSSLFVVSIFVAKITATLTVNELRSSIGSVSDLVGKKVGTTAGSTSATHLASRSVPFSEFDNINALFKALETGELDAIVHDAPVLSYYAQNDGKGLVKTTGSIFRPEKYGIVLPEGSPLREQINRALLRLREDGTYRSLLTKWFGENYR